jgi:hypothetical protein
MTSKAKSMKVYIDGKLQNVNALDVLTHLYKVRTRKQRLVSDDYGI